jgi:hypothetical protein
MLQAIAHAQCDTPPRIVANDAVCNVGEPCTLSIGLETGGQPVASFAATIASSTAQIDCPTTCDVGAASANGTCTISASSCRFLVGDLTYPITSFTDGEGALIDITCNTAGDHTLDLDLPSFGSAAGTVVTGCAASGTITCNGPSSGVCGDSNGDSMISATDALVALRTAVGTSTCPLSVCDVDCSGVVVATDALAILRAATGQPVTLNCTCI